jgi:hypothetical protein
MEKGAIEALTKRYPLDFGVREADAQVGDGEHAVEGDDEELDLQRPDGSVLPLIWRWRRSSLTSRYATINIEKPTYSGA